MARVSCLVQVLVELSSRWHGRFFVLLGSLHVLLKLQVLEVEEPLGWLRFRPFSLIQMSCNLTLFDLFTLSGELVKLQLVSFRFELAVFNLFLIFA